VSKLFFDPHFQYLEGVVQTTQARITAEINYLKIKQRNSAWAAAEDLDAIQDLPAEKYKASPFAEIASIGEVSLRSLKGGAGWWGGSGSKEVEDGEQ
jgi:hypothetical protein